MGKSISYLVSGLLIPPSNIMIVYSVAATAVIAVCCLFFTTFQRAFFTLMLVVIEMGGILRGVFTATEAAAIAVVYSFILSVVVYREIKLKDLPNSSKRTTSAKHFL